VPSAIVLDTVNRYGVNLEKRVIPTGIELDKFLRPEISAADCAELRTSLGILPDETMLLSLSRIAEEKNIQSIIKSLVTVREQIKVKLVIVGSGPYEDKLKRLVKGLALDDIVIFTGLVDNSQTAYYYKAADFFISASTSETQGLTYIESLASGTPVLATDNAYLKSLITEPIFGRLFSGDDAIAATILDAITETPDFDQTHYDQKLYEISAENFALRVYEFYLDKIISNDQYLAQKGESIPRRTARIVRQAPAKTVKTVVRTPKKVAYFAKKAIKHAKILNKYGKIKLK
jgi:1,2-diacylglycerol 3-alpha-glucosyltransferase